MKYSHLLLAFALSLPSVALAHGDKAHDHSQHPHEPGAPTHNHGSPHGGQVKNAGKRHIEMRLQKDQLHVWILDSEEKTVMPPPLAKANVVVGGKKHLLVLKAEEDRLAVALPAGLEEHLRTKKGKASVIVTLAVDGKPRTLRFAFATPAKW